MQGVLQRGDDLSILIRQSRMKGDHRLFVCLRELSLKRCSLLLQGGQPFLYGCAAQNAVGHLIDEPVGSSLNFRQAAFLVCALLCRSLRFVLQGLARFVHGQGDALGRQKLRLDRGQHPLLDLCALRAAAVVADRRAAFSPPGANEALVHPAADHGPAADAAGQLAAQEMPGADGSEGRGLVRSQFVLGVAFSHLDPQRFWHYPQVGRLSADDVRRFAGASATRACLPVLYPRTDSKPQEQAIGEFSRPRCLLVRRANRACDQFESIIGGFAGAMG
ncbi:hypothetical protein ABE406_04965 [Brevundimonas naejangsanensis]